MEQLKDFIKEIQGYKKNLGINPSDDMILDTAVRLFISNNITQGKERNKPPFKQSNHAASPDLTPDNTPATPNQIAALKKMNYLGDTSNLTKHEAWVLINEKKRGQKFPDY